MHSNKIHINSENVLSSLLQNRHKLILIVQRTTAQYRKSSNVSPSPWLPLL